MAYDPDWGWETKGPNTSIGDYNQVFDAQQQYHSEFGQFHEVTTTASIFTQAITDVRDGGIFRIVVIYEYSSGKHACVEFLLDPNVSVVDFYAQGWNNNPGLWGDCIISGSVLSAPYVLVFINSSDELEVVLATDGSGTFRYHVSVTQLANFRL